MTTPKLSRKKRGGREYVWPAKAPHELMVPNVTGILSGGMPTPWPLERWKIKKGVAYTLKHYDALKDLPEEDAIKFAADASQRFMEERAAIGDVVHTAIETYLGKGVLRKLKEPEASYARAALAFLEDYRPEILYAESTVFSREHEYAGTIDAIARLWDDFEDEATILDWKTSAAVRDKHVLQLVGCARADFIADKDGATEIPMPTISRGVVVLLRDDGEYDANPYEMTDELFRVFVAAKDVAPYEQHIRHARMDDFAPPPADPDEA